MCAAPTPSNPAPTAPRRWRGPCVGTPEAAKLLEVLPNKIRDVLGIMADVRLRQENGRDLIEIQVAPYPSPISHKGEFHYRSGSTKQQLKRAALETFLLRRQGRHRDSVPVALRDRKGFGPRRVQAIQVVRAEKRPHGRNNSQR